MTAPRMWVPVLTLVVACGTDETIEARPVPEPTVNVLVPGVDLCSAMWSLVSAPGVAERLCALQTANQAGTETVNNCKLCATSLAFVTDLMPDPSCRTPVEDCPVEDIELDACFTALGEILTELTPACEPEVATPPADPALLALRIATSDCGPVLTQCEPLQTLVVGLIGTAL